ncbi:MAG: hypothetical protein OXD01_16195 [Gammaproteobacteria bacterium]|nr:hypothetical protein [Gammaproteobacteria bacterium]
MCMYSLALHRLCSMFKTGMVTALLSTAVLLFAQVSTSVWAQDQSQLEGSNDRLLTLQRYEADLENLESAFGPFDPRLQEPLTAMERLQRELGDFERVLEIQTRRLQLLRTAQGLEHPDIIPLLEALVRTEIQLGNWEDVSDHLEHLRSLILAINGSDSPEMMEALERQASWFLARVYLDEDRNRVRNFLDARDSYKDLLDMAEGSLDKDDPQLIPWLGKRAYSLHQLVGLLNSGGSISSQMIRETVRRDGVARLQSARSGLGVAFSSFDPLRSVPITEKGEVVGSGYLRMAAGYFNDIRKIAEAQGDWEIWAMATLYHGDYNFLTGLRNGRSDYLNAIEKLEELGYSKERLEAFFARPMIIPAQQFYPRFSEYEAHSQLIQGTLSPVDVEGHALKADKPWNEPMHAGVFYAWEEGAATVAMPVLTDPLFALNLSYHEVDLQFRVNSRGAVSSVKVLQTQPEESRARGIARRAVRKMRFRPAIYDGRTRSRPVVQLRYRVVPDE